mmetsp:Transcript_23904/g.20873  ORF Transcript_23904/g.20873 Transcript_23904/m.20873 type:complete len:177 (-) Transcript_23904:580-1110(-)
MMSGNTFKTNKIPPLNGGAIYFTGIGPNKVAFHNMTFDGLVAMYGGAISYDNPNGILNTIEECYFYNNYAYVDGGAIYRASEDQVPKNTLGPETRSVGIWNSVFVGNKAERNGGCIYAKFERVHLGYTYYVSPDIFTPSGYVSEGNKFYNNTAENGAVMFLVSEDTLSESVDGHPF